MVTYNHISEIERAAARFIELTDSAKVIAFYGEMGAGKTTFIREICRQYGVVDEVNSPTFSIVNEYHTAQGEIFYHFDFYRIKNLTEAFDLGYEEYFYSGNKCFIEWPEKAEQLLPADCLRVKIIPDGNKRDIVF
ncbi:MAG: tRNA (adenosine(37)-N6)-threonylcarbamoyltransferase complex ATPase subunit type 1 TsaE [Bacteroidetes bacterium GWF2_38_335]|nr:MAG: tRNA (adenosine(37)-N6)-threonylcarbamoyltransferase complex ATPase subunit type 1 TsaE [Bacteroidetes bacterium GWF2_38_335]OFY77906.1 MAG: tRNA (adenosine(37)-N6)-threonylcarbamoyltransferase complex ATPase subunit type 1 TsaE [Bacteroidetes bacterium RIFOXYA12_FULL_38_20]HBS86645.1 tRNA (adenosine(37)-N6)-threonylcarbamoyltransferase complex ATPase subunit type 1 TsaE [Bacteroidales bacterium]